MGLLNVQSSVVNYKRRLQAGIFSSNEPDLNSLSFELDHAERVLLVTSCVVQVRERTQRRQHSS